MDTLRPLILTAALMCLQPFAHAAEPSTWQASVMLIAEAMNAAQGDDPQADDPALSSWLEGALMDWRFFDGCWAAPGSEGLVPTAPDFVGPLKRIARSRRWSRAVVLTIAEIWRTQAQTAMDLLMAYMLVQGIEAPSKPAGQPGVFSPTHDDERRILRLGLRQLRTLVDDDDDPLSAALRAEFERGADATLLSRFESLSESTWLEDVEALLALRDTPHLGFWAIHPGAVARLREVRVHFAGLTDQSIE